tara:strand:- start:817 stop:1167 length:351 start_codon:yes stop_codon:yes gene_type:complete
MLHFDIQEFDDPTLQNSGINMDATFLQMLDDARGIAGIPFTINSGYRTKEHNEKVGGVSNSSHLVGKAADIKVGSGSERYIILDSLIKAGFKRLGVGQTFLHCDNDETKPNSIWTY